MKEKQAKQHTPMSTPTTTDLDFQFTISDLKRMDFALPYAMLKGPDRLALVVLLEQAQCPETMCAQYFIASRHSLKTMAKQLDWAAMAKAPVSGTGAKPKRVKAYSTALFRLLHDIDAALMRSVNADLAQADWSGNLAFGDPDTQLRAQPSPPKPPGEPWYDAATWSAAHAEAAAGKSDESREWKRALESMQSNGEHKSYATLAKVSALDAIKKTHPNFAEVIEFVATQIALAKRKNTPHLRLTPVLLEGPPGVGKSHFARVLARVLGTELNTINIASQSAGFVLSGLHRSWSGGCMGDVASTLKRSQTLSPVFFLDELDKPGQGGKSDPLGPLYALLEKDSAARFTDEYLSVAINASHITWLAAVNDASSLPPPLLSRFTRFAIAAPTAQDMRNMARSHYQQLRLDWSELPAQMPDEWLKAIESLSLRAMGQHLESALGRAAMRAEMAGTGSVELQAEDMHMLPHAKPRIGFLAG